MGPAPVPDMTPHYGMTIFSYFYIMGYRISDVCEQKRGTFTVKTPIMQDHFNATTNKLCLVFHTFSRRWNGNLSQQPKNTEMCHIATMCSKNLEKLQFFYLLNQAFHITPQTKTFTYPLHYYWWFKKRNFTLSFREAKRARLIYSTKKNFKFLLTTYCAF